MMTRTTYPPTQVNLLPDPLPKRYALGLKHPGFETPLVIQCPECGAKKTIQLVNRVKTDLCPKCYRKRYQRTFARKNRARTAYGLTLEEYDALRLSPCGLCGASDKPSVADHNHATGALRGPLCYKCNTLVGYLETAGDELVDAARAYIARKD